MQVLRAHTALPHRAHDAVGHLVGDGFACLFVGDLLAGDLPGLRNHVGAEGISLAQRGQLVQQCPREPVLRHRRVVRREPVLLQPGLAELPVVVLVGLRGGRTLRLAQLVGDGVAFRILLHDGVRVTIETIERHVDLVDEVVLQQHPLESHHRGQHEPHGLGEILRVAGLRLVLGHRHQLCVGCRRVLPLEHRLHQRQGRDRILEAPQDLHRVPGGEESLDAQHGAGDLLDDEVHLGHRPAGQSLLVGGDAEPLRQEGDLIHEHSVSVAEVVGDVPRVVQVRHPLELGSSPASTILVILAGEAVASGDQAEREQARQGQARLHERV